MSWIVTRHDQGMRTRVSLGGRAAVTVATSDGRKLQFVVRDLQAAGAVAEALRP